MRINVVTICLNAADCIDRTICSVFSQKDVNIQYIIKDGNSNDNTKNIVNNTFKYYYNDNVEMIYVSQKDSGIYSAMNQAIDLCEGEWTIFLNAGDEFTHEYILKEIVSFIKEKEGDVIYGNAIVRDNEGDSIWYGNLSLINKKMPFCHQACLIKVKLLKQLKFDKTYKIAGDYDLVFRLYNMNALFSYINENIAIYYLDGISSCQYRNRLKDTNTVRSRNNCKMSFCEYYIKYFEAYIKEVIDNKFPTLLKTWFRAIYKKHIKKYGKV